MSESEQTSQQTGDGGREDGGPNVRRTPGAEDRETNGGQQQTEGQQQTQTREETQGGVGTVVEIKGVVVDVRFDEEDIPEIFNALRVEMSGEEKRNPSR